MQFRSHSSGRVGRYLSSGTAFICDACRETDIDDCMTRRPEKSMLT